jgi:hypothetical protein
METKLDRARRHVDEARQMVVDQQARIARLERAGRSTVTARILLASLTSSLALEEQAARQVARLANEADG